MWAAAIDCPLKGIGKSKAEAIVAWREQNGSFKSAEELAKVQGIGDKTVAANRELILVEGTAANIR